MLIAVLTVLGVLLIIASASEGREGNVKIGAFLVAVLGIALLLGGLIPVVNEEGIKEGEGLPRGTHSVCMLPPESLPIMVKMGYFEEGHYYMTATPYNKINTSIPIYYQIPTEEIENLDDIKPGIVIINDRGILKKFPITLEV